MPHLSKTTIAFAACLGAWSPASHACTTEPVISSICIMSLNPTGQFAAFNNTYVLAAGQVLAISQYTALFALIGTTYGGNGSTTFNLPDLRSRTIVGFDPRDAARTTGASGGSATVNLSVAQLPQHAMTVTNLPVTLSNVQAITTLSGLTATANLGGMVIRGQATGLTMKAVSGANGLGTPANNYLGKAVTGTSSIYSNATPNATLNANAIGGELTLAVNANTNAPVTGSATTTVTGEGTASGTSAVIGSGAGVPVMPPYLVLPYYIAVNGIFPSGN